MYINGTTKKTTLTPTLKCAEKTNDNYSRYTVATYKLSSEKKTNGKLIYPIGLLSVDEAIFAGAKPGLARNTKYYLYNTLIPVSWLLTPSDYNGTYACVWQLEHEGDLYSNSVTNSIYFRPVINIKPDILLNSGDGTSANPYMVKLS